jgi:prolyl-tRNA synthetase
VLDQNGKLQTVIMGSYGVGVSRAVACVAEGNHDELGLRWPREISPVDVHLVAAGKDMTRDPEVFTKAEELTRELEAAGVSVLYDDRHKVSPGVKFKDSELIGIPTIVVVGKSLEHGVVEVKDRATGERTEVAVGEVVETVRRLVAGAADTGAAG